MTVDYSNGCATYRTTRFVDTRHFIGHSARVTIKHWQLRDLVCKSAIPNQVLYVSGNHAKTLNFETGRRGKCAEFLFEPRCIAADHGIVVVGGFQRGQLAVTALNDRTSTSTVPPVHSFELGGYINNAITLFDRGSGNRRALVCNNDHSLRLLDINQSGHKVLDSLQLPVSLNHSSISPDQKTVIACGDSPHLFILHPEEPHRASLHDLDDSSSRLDGLSSSAIGDSPERWKQYKTLATSADAGFSTAFNPAGILFAVAAQDGIATVFDSRYFTTSEHTSSSIHTSSPASASSSSSVRAVRYSSADSSPLRIVQSTRPMESSGAFRCLKFSSGSEDLLLIAEQAGRVHVVDSRRFEYRQVLDIPNLLGPRHLSRWATSQRSGDSSRNSDETRYRAIYNWPSPELSYQDALRPSRPYGRFFNDSDMRESEAGEIGDEDEDDEIICHDLDTRYGMNFETNDDVRAEYYAESAAREKEISGLAWSPDNGGSIIVGWDGGIGRWPIDRWGRRVFQSYIMS
ncbi:WD40-repeat-containing domain protein [Lipomyces oligophaga]|uniref:WD40-repeat-containing domain protein n=1 Tax=Lipomyces oligophaga TaxID=45792 RepID=UPI0034CD54AB